MTIKAVECLEGIARKRKIAGIERKTEMIRLVFRMVLLYGSNSLIMFSVSLLIV